MIYMNDREHSTTKVAPFRAMMNADNNDLIYKIQENTIKRIKKVKILQKLKKKDFKDYLILLDSFTKAYKIQSSKRLLKNL